MNSGDFDLAGRVRRLQGRAEALKREVLVSPGLSALPAATVSLLALSQVVRPFGPFGTLGMIGVSGVFGLGAYSVSVDKENGPSIATAWTVAYLFTFARDSLNTRRVAPILLTASVLGSSYCYIMEIYQAAL